MRPRPEPKPRVVHLRPSPPGASDVPEPKPCPQLVTSVTSPMWQVGVTAASGLLGKARASRGGGHPHGRAPPFSTPTPAKHDKRVRHPGPSQHHPCAQLPARHLLPGGTGLTAWGWWRAGGQATWQGRSGLRRPRDVLRDRGPSIVPDYKRFWLVAFTRSTVSRGLWELAPIPLARWGFTRWPLHLPPSPGSVPRGRQTRREGRGGGLSLRA